LKKRIWAALVAVSLLGFLLVDVFLIEPYRLQVEEAVLSFTDLPASLQGLRILQISDTHIKAFRGYEQQVQARIRALQPDLIVFTGDFIEYAPSYDIWLRRVEEVGKFLDGLPPTPYGTWATLGNSDITRYGGHNDLLVRRIRKSGVKLLLNQHAQLDIGGERLYLIGTDFAHLLEGFSADCVTASEQGNTMLAVGPSKGNSFAHYLPEDWTAWGEYEFSGRLRYTDPAGGIGVIWGSRFPLGEDYFYRLRRYKDAPVWEFSPRGAKVTAGTTSTSLQLQPNTWYRFRIRWEVEDDQARIRARIWQEGEPEPTEWPVDCTVRAAQETVAPQAGTIGFWGVGPGWKYFDDLQVTGKALAWREDFESYPVQSDPPHWLDFGINKGNLAEAMRGVPREAFTILLAHSPDIIGQAAAAGLDLVLSGHTHGGQVRLPLVGPLYVNAELGGKYNQGLFRFGSTQLYVNRGIGTRFFPIRFLCPPEITVFTLRRG